MVDKYIYQIEWSNEDKVYICKCLEFPGLVAHGNSQEKALKEGKSAVRLAIKMLKEEGKEDLPLPIKTRTFPKTYPLRLPEDVRRELETEAAENSISLNQLITKKLKGA